jgi:hypothetical protein
MTVAKRGRGFFELYRDDPERTDALIFGRVASVGRRGFLKGAGPAAMGAALGGAIPFAGSGPAGWSRRRRRRTRPRRPSRKS